MNLEIEYLNLKNSYQQQLTFLLIQIVHIYNKQQTIKGMLLKVDKNSIAYTMLQNQIAACQNQLEIIKVQWEIIINSIISIDNAYINNHPNLPPIINDETKKLTAAKPAVEKVDSINETIELAIKAEFENLKQLFEQYKAEKDISKKEKISTEIEQKKASLTKLKAKLSSQMRGALKSGKITAEQFTAFKNERAEIYKIHSKLYSEIARSIQKDKPTQALDLKNTPFIAEPQAPLESIDARSNGITIVRVISGTNIKEVAQAIAGQRLICNFNGIKIDGTKYKTASEVIDYYEKQFEAMKKAKEAKPRQEAPVKQETPITPKDIAQRSTNSLAASVKKAQELKKEIEQVPSSIKKEMSLTSNKEDLAKLQVQLDEETKVEQGSYTYDLNSKLKKLKEKIGIKKDINPDLLTQRNRLADEINQMKTMYGTVQNEEYQMRVEQLKKLDKKIFNHIFNRKANRIYRDLSKPIALIGGTAIELPKAFLDMRLENDLKSK